MDCRCVFVAGCAKCWMDGGEITTRIKKEKGENETQRHPPAPTATSFTLSRPVGGLVIVAVQIDFQVNYSHVPLIIIISPLRPLLTPSVPLFSRRASLIARFNILDPCRASALAIPAGAPARPEWPPVKVADLLIDKERPAMSGKKRMRKKSRNCSKGKKERSVGKGQRHLNHSSFSVLAKSLGSSTYGS